MGSRDAFLLTPLIQMIILALGWRSSYLMLATAVIIIIVPLSLFLRARPEDMGLLPDGEATVKEKADSPTLDKKWASTTWTLLEAIKKYQFFAFFFLMIGAGFSTGALINHFVALVTDFGFTVMFSASLLLIYAIASLTGRCCGFTSDLIGRERTFTLSMAMMLFPLPILLITKDTSIPWLLYVFITCFGFGVGLYGPTYAASVADLFQGNRLGTIIGSANIGYGLGAAVGTWLYGYIFDVTGTYTLAVVIAMLAICVMCTSIWVAAPRKVRRVASRASGATWT